MKKFLLHVDYPDAPYRIQAMHLVASNWRIRQRLPRLTALAIEQGVITDEYDGMDI